MNKEISLKLNLQIENAETVEQLEKAIQDINEQLDKVDKNSESFNELTELSQKANSKINNLSTSVNQLDSDLNELDSGLKEVETSSEKLGEEISSLDSDVSNLNDELKELDKVSKLSVDIDNAQTVEELETALEQINAELKEVDENSEAFSQLQSLSERANKDIQDTNDSIKKLNGQTSTLENGMEGLNRVTEMFGFSTDKLSQGLQGAYKNVTSLAKGMRATTAASGKTSGALKLLRAAVISTGIGALVIAIVSLLSYFTKTQRGADMVSKAMAGIGAVVDVIIDRFSALGEGLIALFKGDFSDAAEIFTNALSGIGEEISREAQAAWKLEEALQALEQKEIDLITVQAKRRAEINKLQLIAEENVENRVKAANAIRKAIELENKIANDSILVAKERARILNEQLALGESTREDMREAAQANAEVIQLEGERDLKLRELTGRLRSFTQAQKEATEAVDLSKDITDEEEASFDEFDSDMQKLIDEGQAMIDEEARQNKLSEDEAKRHADAMLAYEEWRADRVQALEESSAQVRKELALDLYDNLIAMTNSFFADTEEGQKKAFEFNKKVQIAETIVSTYLSAQKAFTSQIIPGDPTSPARGAIAAGLAIAGGLARVVTISNTKFNSSSAPTSTAPQGTSSGEPQPRNLTPATPTIDTDSGERTTKVYVTETDIRETTDRVGIIYTKATVVE